MKLNFQLLCSYEAGQKLLLEQWFKEYSQYVEELRSNARAGGLEPVEIERLILANTRVQFAPDESGAELFVCRFQFDNQVFDASPAMPALESLWFRYQMAKALVRFAKEAAK